MGSIKKVPVIEVGKLAVGSSTSFRYGFQQGIAYNDQGTIKAYVNFCTHAGGPVKQCGKVFECQRHHATFDVSTGERLSGQAPEGTSLKSIQLITEGDMIYALWEIKDEFE